MEDCIGKQLLANKIATVSEERAKALAPSKKVADALFKRLNDTFCCVELPIRKRKFNIWKFKNETYEVKEKLSIKLRQHDETSMHIDIKTPIPEWNNDTLTYVVKVETDIDPETKSLRTLIFFDWGKVTEDAVVEALLSRFANYILKFNSKEGKE